MNLYSHINLKSNEPEPERTWRFVHQSIVGHIANMRILRVAEIQRLRDEMTGTRSAYCHHATTHAGAHPASWSRLGC